MPGDFDGILRWPQVHDLVGLSRSTIWRLVRAGQFPTPIKISRRAVGWRSSDVRGWLRSRAPKTEKGGTR